ncbi:hypothetical protein PHAVU_009G015800 [Phaseolus vulgaris]|uniref:Replication factor A C-terminal domain-containing protein n=1 Tax=Phaseolus vulgaris TaxID=3885 RepID=V7ATY4_PHAVU|nr:hypothetical protein PHAVU_009G015800g [Phaseolus vulgaris]ESW08073.1 hypothetical protein PHAVU_009G015800g [Phaseolus vulgaris]
MYRTKISIRICSSSDSPFQGLKQLSESSKHSLEDEFLQLTPRNTIESLKDCKEAMYPDSKMFFCEKCKKHVMKVFLRYKIKLCVVDETNSTTFILFDREANSLLNKSCAEIFESHDKVDSRNDQGIRFEQSFRVKMVCFEEQIIQTFMEGRRQTYVNKVKNIPKENILSVMDLLTKFLLNVPILDHKQLILEMIV